MKNKKQTRETLHSHGLALMDKAFEKQFGVKLTTAYDIIEQRYISRSEEALTPEHSAYISGYSKALVDMFIAARL